MHQSDAYDTHQRPARRLVVVKLKTSVYCCDVLLALSSHPAADPRIHVLSEHIPGAAASIRDSCFLLLGHVSLMIWPPQWDWPDAASIDSTFVELTLQAAWSLVLSKDPHIKAKPAAPEAAAEDSGLQEKLYLQHGVQAAVPAATTQPAASQQHSSDPTRLGGSIITAGLRSSVVLQSQGKDAAGFPTASKGTASGSSNASRSPRKPSQQQRQGDNLAVLAGDESTLPLELHTGAAPTQREQTSICSTAKQPYLTPASVKEKAWFQTLIVAQACCCTAHLPVPILIE